MPFGFKRKGTRKSMGNGEVVAPSEKSVDVQKRSLRDLLKRGKNNPKSRSSERPSQRQRSEPVVGKNEASAAITASEEEHEKAVPPPRPVQKPRRPVKLPAILNLKQEDAEQLFSGAPQFSGESASFPWNSALEVRDQSDSRPLEHPAFSSCTLHKHLPYSTIIQNLTYDIGVYEVPNMLAFTGREPGTVGMAYYLQESGSDSLYTRPVDENPEEVFENFSNFELLESQPEKLGIRKFELAVVAERLSDLSNLYQNVFDNGGTANILKQQSCGDLYAALFGKILTPPKYDSSAADPTGLKVQIEALIHTLNLKRIWYDFSSVEWRIRIGQLIFTEISFDASSSNLSKPDDGLTEREVILLQLLLACELYVRLEAIASMSLEECQEELQLTNEDVERFQNLESRKTKWDLVLAGRFLQNVEAKTVMRSKWIEQGVKRSLAQSFFRRSQPETSVKVEGLDIALSPRRRDQQINGLFHFARAIDWPDAQAFEKSFNNTLAGHGDDSTEAGTPSLYLTPLSTPGTLTPKSFRSGNRSSYFASNSGGASPEMSPRHFQLQPPSSLDLLSDSANSLSQDNGTSILEATGSEILIGGWLTRSYLIGLVLPGEPISHLLVSSMLENDTEAVARVGEDANLYGGFAYKGRSFWSKASIVGRVLACLQNSRECMGWISSALSPEGESDGWFDITATPCPVDEFVALASGSDLFGGKEVRDVQFKDFTLPQDSEPGAVITSVPCIKLFLRDVRTEEAVDGGVSSSIASLEFNSLPVEASDTFQPRVLDLKHLVQYISSFPCTPPHVSAMTKLSSDAQGEDSTKWRPKKTGVPGHPLHRSYEYKIIPVVDLLKQDFQHGEDNDQISNRKMVKVIDARGHSGIELLARAWCSSEGFNALVSRVGTTCLACSIREARGLGLSVIIRIGGI